MRFGAHMSIAGGIDNAPLRGREVGCDTIQIFTKNNNQWKAKRLLKEEIQRFKKNQKETNISPVVVHTAYLINIASADEKIYQKSLDALSIEMERTEALGLPYLVLHPGAHLGSGEKNGLDKIIQSLNILHKKAKNFKMKILLETTAGQGTSLGYCFEHFACILEGVKEKNRLGMCLDTSHVFAAGYNIKIKKGYEETMKLFDSLIGIDKIKAFHVNDSKRPLGSRVDRHEHIGRGFIGKNGFKHLLRDERFSSLPMILETPKDFEGADRKNLRVLRRIAGH